MKIRNLTDKQYKYLQFLIDKPNSLKLTILHDNLDELAQKIEESEKI